MRFRNSLHCFFVRLYSIFMAD